MLRENGTVYIMMQDDFALEIRLRKTGTFSAREARHPALNLRSAQADSTSLPQPRNAEAQRTRRSGTVPAKPPGR